MKGASYCSLILTFVWLVKTNPFILSEYPRDFNHFGVSNKKVIRKFEHEVNDETASESVGLSQNVQLSSWWGW